MIMKEYIVFIFIIVMLVCCGLWVGDKPVVHASTPREILHFAPVCKGSDPNDIRIAQAELCRHEIGVKIDGEFGKQTAFGVCELLVKIQNGYKIRSIYDKRMSK